jgi:dihydroorotase-like cyclic amidohydrolase
MLASLYNRSVHICHVARKSEITIIKAAKEKVWSVLQFYRHILIFKNIRV